MSRKKSRLYDVSDPILAVYLYDRKIGAIGRAGTDVWFKYDQSVVDDAEPQRWQLSIRLPVTNETHGHESTLVFFDNLLLESDLRASLAQASRHDVTDTTGLLGQIGAECAGAVALWPFMTAPPEQHVYREISKLELESIFSEQHGSRIAQLQLESRQSLSGVQHKLVFARTDDRYLLPLQGSPSTVVLKRTSGRYDGLAINEHVCIRLFAALNLPVPATTLINGPAGILETRRYDRIVDAQGKIERLHQEDFCQATGRGRNQKYQQSGGPGFGELVEILRRHSASPARNIGDLVKAAVANVCLGNMDAHAKNYSLLYHGGAVELAPFYDIVCTEAYDELGVDMSMNIGSTRHPNAITFADLTQLAKTMRISIDLVLRAVEEVSVVVQDQLQSVLDRACEEFGTHAVLDRMQAIFTDRIGRMQKAAVKPHSAR